jgi:quercetin dioxygenase-like cupin family protein
MNVFDAVAMACEAKAANPTRPATSIAHDSPDARVVLFRIEPRQEVAPHTSRSSVVLVILSGSGLVVGADGERPVRAGDIVAYAPEEKHGMRALDEQLVLAAVIAPRPAARQP